MSKLLVISELFTAAQLLPIYNEIQVKMDGKELKRFRSNMQARERTVKAIEAYQEANDVEVDFERSVWEEKGIQFFTAEEEKVEEVVEEVAEVIETKDSEPRGTYEEIEEVRTKKRQKGAVKDLWNLFDTLWDQGCLELKKEIPSRKWLLEQCVEAGYNFYTSRTQYQQYYKARLGK